MKVTGTAGQILGTLERIACPHKGKALFEVLQLHLKDGRVDVAIRNENNSSFVRASAPLGEGWKGEGVVVVSASELIDRLAPFDARENVSIAFGDDGEVRISSKRRRLKFYAEAREASHSENEPEVRDGWVFFPLLKEGLKTKVRASAEELQSLEKDQKVVGDTTFPFTFERGSPITLRLGGEDAKSPTVEVDLESGEFVDGENAYVRVCEDFAAVVANTTGTVEVQAREDFPVSVLCGSEGERYFYVIANRAE